MSLIESTGAPVSVLIVGAGRMAATHARRFGDIDATCVNGVVDVAADRLQRFARTHAIPSLYRTLDEALDSGRFQAASIVTPDAAHADASIACLDAGLDVLCEKPLSDTIESASRMVAAAEANGAVNMVNLVYRNSGALHEMARLVAGGALGELRHVEASYRQSWLVSPYWGDWRSDDAWLWRLSTRHGSQGVLGDIGIHLLDFVLTGCGLSITGLHCRLQTFEKAPGNRIAEYHLDANDSCVINAEFSNGALGVLHLTRYATGYMNALQLCLHGTEGAARVSLDLDGDSLELCLDDDRDSMTWRQTPCASRPDTFDRFTDAVSSGAIEEPTFRQAATLQSLLECCHESHRSGRWLSTDPFPARATTGD